MEYTPEEWRHILNALEHYHCDIKLGPNTDRDIQLSTNLIKRFSEK